MRKKKEVALNKVNAIKDSEKTRNLWLLMRRRVEGYGFKYSLADFIKTMVLFLTVMVLVGTFMKLSTVAMIIFLAIVAVQIPLIIVSQFKYIYEQNRFNDVCTYMEQMAYSFKKSPKIINALTDTLEICSGKMEKLIQEAIQTIQESTDPDLYRIALKKIEDEYACSRLLQLHKFMITVEEKGGEYQNSMDILIDDIASWTQRTYVFQKERADIKTKIMISLVLALGVCSTTLFMLPENMDITGSTFYQIETVFALSIFVLIYTLTQTKLNGSWLINDSVKDRDKIIEDYEFVHNASPEKEAKKSKVKILILLPLLAVFIFMGNTIAVLMVCIAMLVLYSMPGQRLKGAQKRTLREIEKEFPGWCREIALNLQTENVYQALSISRATAPYVLEPALNELVHEIDENPRSVLPYNKFLKEYNIPEVNRMMKTLYSLSEYGVQNAEEQINKIIIQNNSMVDKAERLKNEDSTTGVKFLTLVPMFLGSVKMMADLFLLIGNFMAITGTFGL